MVKNFLTLLITMIFSWLIANVAPRIPPLFSKLPKTGFQQQYLIFSICVHSNTHTHVNKHRFSHTHTHNIRNTHTHTHTHTHTQGVTHTHTQTHLRLATSCWGSRMEVSERISTASWSATSHRLFITASPE